MQEQTLPPLPPLPPQPPSPPGLPQATVWQPGDFRVLSREEVAALRARRAELSDQLRSATDRREELVEELKSMPIGAQQGILDRIAVLDKRLVQIETDIAETGRVLTSAGGLSGGTLQSPNGRFQMDADAVGKVAGLFTVFVLAPLAFAIARSVWRRSSASARPVTDPALAARMERMEQAVDAIAIEVERVGEAQRYQARLLAEGQRPAEPVRVPQYEPAHVREP